MTRQWKLNQWKVRVGGSFRSMYTPTDCDVERAMAIAVASFGQDVTLLENEGTFRQSLNDLQMHVADPKNCKYCGNYYGHSDECPTLKVGA